MNPFKAATGRDAVYLVLIAAYSVLFIAGHDHVSQFYGWLIAGLDRQIVEAVLFWGALLSVLGGFTCVLARRPGDILFWVEGILLGILLWLSSAMLICTNVESVHYPQYAVLGFLVRSLIGGDLVALLFCNFVGMADEFIQYVLNPHYTKYLDFNDMILNMIGVMVGISLWRWVRGGLPNPLLIPFWRQCVVLMYGLLAAIGAWGVASGRVVLYWRTAETPFTALQRAGDKTVFVLSYVDTSSFYLTTGLGRRYHVMSAVEWGAVSLFLLALAWGLSCWRKRLREL